MTEIPIRNTTRTVVVDDHVFEAMSSDPDLLDINALKGLSLHKMGFAWRHTRKDGGYATVVVHRWVADNFLPKPSRRSVVVFKNGDRLDCRIENLELQDYSEFTKRIKADERLGKANDVR
jgi:hypothetical protein